MGLPTPTIAPEVEKAFMEYSWPGNIRELSNVIERFLALCHEPKIDLSNIPEFPTKCREKYTYCSKKFKRIGSHGITFEGIQLENFMENLEKNLIEQALIHAKYSQKKAAQILGLTPRSLR
jgi:DNA-binding NtrC family response regulator